MSERVLKAIKIINIVCGAVILLFGFFGIFFVGLTGLLSGQFFMLFSPLFMMVFGAALLASQFKVDIVLKKVGFLRSLLGRGIFNIYLASEVFYYFSCGSNLALLGWIFGIALFAMGLLYFGLQFCAGNAYAQKIKAGIS